MLSICAALLAQLLHACLNLADVGTQGAHFGQYIVGLFQHLHGAAQFFLCGYAFSGFGFFLHECQSEQNGKNQSKTT
ncbi:TPA: hypothetical protein SMF61_000045 [Serratia marcescens]|nr:hypothetical protein [Serratia marcescens]HBH7556329.1 hypothetical protein [Serratia marcescens]HEJ0019679.1 hypothetical protein [Serratia marcescens]HEJ7061408.1 hypothetical protein [Serratia marcescens]